MKMLMRNLKFISFLFILIAVSLLTGLSFQQYRSKTELYVAAGENKQALRSRYAQAGSIFDINGLVLAKSVDGDRKYSDDAEMAKSVLHIVGDYTHNIGNTIESTYQGILLGNDRNVLRQLYLDVLGKGLSGDDITLTLDGKLSKKAYDLLDGRKGSIVLINYKTGAVLSAVSSPSTSPESVISYKDIPDTALFNRALSGSYAPGSTFKIVTAAAFFSSSVYDPTLVVDCNGQSTVDPFAASETGSGHGKMDLASAFAKSCNVYFGQIGVTIGKDTLVKEANAMGYGHVFSLDRLEVTPGKINVPDNASTLSWISIGQPVSDSTLYTTPLHMAMLVGAIGNNGVMVKAHIIDHITTPAGEEYDKLKVSTEMTIMNEAESKVLENLMIGVVTDGTGKDTAINGYTVAAKTGTVQVDGQKNNALCVAYIAEDDMPYAVAVIVEEGGAGGTTAAPIAGKILKAVISSQKSN
jgi:peptidoglycan glycosyltransferase